MNGMADTFSRGGRPARDANREVRIKELCAKIGAREPQPGYDLASVRVQALW